MPAESNREKIRDLAEKEVDQRQSEGVKGGTNSVPSSSVPPLKKVPSNPRVIVPCI